MLLYRALFNVTYGYVSDCSQIGSDFALLLYLYAEMQSIASPLDEACLGHGYAGKFKRVVQAS